MAFNTKIDLSNAKVYQADGQQLTLSGDTCIDAVGRLAYLTDQSAVFNTTPRAVPDVAWVTGKTDAITVLVGNGLTKLSDKRIVLGGNLTGNTAICTCAKLFNIYGCDSSNYLQYYYAGGATNNSQFVEGVLSGPYSAFLTVAAISGTGWNYSQVNQIAQNNTTGQRSETVVLPNYVQLQDGRLGKWNTFNMSTGSTVFTDAYTSKGIVYGGDYENQFSPRSLVTKQYVSSQTSGVTTNAICCASNGLTKSGIYATLGGTLTGATTITAPASPATQLTFTDSRTPTIGIQYGGCYHAGYTARSLVDAAYVTGMTSQANCAISIAPKAITGVTNGLTKIDCHNACLGGVLTSAVSIIGPQPFTVKSSTLNLSGSTCIGINSPDVMLVATPPTGSAVDSILTRCSTGEIAQVPFSTVTGNSIVTASNGLCKTTNNVKLGGAIIENTCVTGAYVLGANMNQVNLTGATGGVNLGGSGVKLTATIPGSGGLLCLGAGGVVSQTSLSAFGGVTGATNGLTNCGNQQIGLGGNLCADTVVQSGAGSRKLTLGRFCGLQLATSGETDMILVGQGNGAIWLKSESGTGAITNGTTNAVGISADFNGSSGFQIFDNRAGSNQTGIVYASNYSTNYVNRSLVDKQYVDSIATGLNVHTAVRLATTTSITLSGNQTIDGVLTVNGDRILVKNQGIGNTGATTNGIYIASASTWVRADDYNGTPSGEVSNGDLIPVTTGSTQNNSLWALTSLNPITVGVTPLIFSLFANTIDVQEGPGIAITQVGGVHTVCVLLGTSGSTGCGLAVSSTGLCVNPTIAGSGLTYTSGSLSVRASNGGSATSIPVKFNAGCCLVLNCADINSALNAITGATNGLTKAGQQVKLGGTITGATTLTLSAIGTPSLLFTDSRVGSSAVGLQYTAPYGANFTARSIPDAAWVTGLTACANAISLKAITGVTNGLTCVATHCARLGGNLTQTTSIFYDGFDFDLCTASGNGLALASASCVGMINMCDVTTNCHGAFAITPTEVSLQLTQSATTQSVVIVRPTCAEMHYSNDGTTTCAVIGGYAGGCALLRSIGVGACKTSISLTPNCGLISSDCTTFKGLQYLSGGYRANFVCNSLVDAAYVTGKTSGVAVTASNGLTKLGGNNIVLGGTLTGNTNIVTTSRSLTFSGASASYFTCSKTGADDMAVCQTATSFRAVGTGTCATCIGLSSVTGVASLYGQCCVRIDGSTCIDLCGNTSRIVLAANYIKLTSNICLATTPNAGATSDAVLVWNSGDKEVKTVSGAALGDKNNVYAKTVVTVNTTGTTASTYVQLISGATSFTLPSAPIAGQAFKFKDAIGTALATPVVINAGVGKTIDGPGNQCALINTDYGALELVYGATNKWFSLAFIN